MLRFSALSLRKLHLSSSSYNNFLIRSPYVVSLPNKHRFFSISAPLQQMGFESSVLANNHTHKEIIGQSKLELTNLAGTPALVTKIESMALENPGVESNMDLYRALYPFKLDGFQEQCISELIAGKNVLLSTPTGSGKTLVGELAIYYALMMGLRVAYTTPLKALSNQKFKDFKARFGGDRVGLMTGDTTVNARAPVLVMTTEVFRNMIYGSNAENQLADLFMVCFDEFHFMNDPGRGSVWEESVISCPKDVRILALSATMGNVQAVQGWIQAIHGPTTLVQSTFRPVPLKFLYAGRTGLLPLFQNPEAGPGAPLGVQYVDQPDTSSKRYDKREKSAKRVLDAASSLNRAITKLAKSKVVDTSPNGKKGPSGDAPSYINVAKELQASERLPAIVFIFSRKGCDDAARTLVSKSAGLKLLNKEELAYVDNAITEFVAANPEIPLRKEALRMLRSGVGVHHAGLIGVWRSFVEELFNAGKTKVLFATETLAAGVNMPARTTVISAVTKMVNKEPIRLKTSQMLQMAGRAGRRGKDRDGSVVLLQNPREDVSLGHRILTAPMDSVKSHFQLSYSMAIKLLETRSVEECQALVEQSFGTFTTQQRLKKRGAVSSVGDDKKVAEESVDQYWEVLNRFTLNQARDYLLWVKTLEKERRSLVLLDQEQKVTDREIVKVATDMLSVGTAVRLFDDSEVIFLGRAVTHEGEDHEYWVIDRIGQVHQVRKEHIGCIPDRNAITLAPIYTKALVGALKSGALGQWTEVQVSEDSWVLTNSHLTESFTGSTQLEPSVTAALLKITELKKFPVSVQSGAMRKQLALMADLEKRIKTHGIYLEGKEQLVVEALKYISKLKDPAEFLMKKPIGKDGSAVSYEQHSVAWRRFLSVLATMKQAKAVNPEDNSVTALGLLVSSLSTDNELWVATLLKHPSVVSLGHVGLASVLCATVVAGGHKMTTAYFKYGASDELAAVFDELENDRQDLKDLQAAVDVEFPVELTREVAGLVESWMTGVSWRELCKETSLDQGDLCRMLRRTVELLRQLPRSYGLSPSLAQVAQESAEIMDRFPVADLTVAPEKRSSTTTILDPATGQVVQVVQQLVDVEDEGEEYEDGAGFEEEQEEVLDDLFDLLDEDEDGDQ